MDEQRRAQSDDTTTTQRLSPLLAAVLTFTAAASVLVLEIAAGRLLAPYVGVSLTTYTGIIGAILAGIALGAWLGGKAADAFGPLPLIGPTFVLGGVSAIAAVPIVGLFGGAGLGGGLIAIVVLAATGFVVPAAVLSAAGPMLVRGTLTDLATSGTIVGRLSAIGTVGAITGTFLTGFVLLGLVPTRVLIVSVGLGLAVVGVALTVWLRQRGRASASLLLVAVLLTGGFGMAQPNPCDAESAYYCIAINTDATDPDVRVLVLDRLTHAAVDLRDPTNLEFGYLRRFADATTQLRAALGTAPDVLHVGGGGFTFPRYIAAVHPEARQTVLELDPRILEIARSELGYVPSDRIDVKLGDARQSIRALPSDTFDLVFGDAFGGLAVPWHLTTTEFLDEVTRVLRPGGAYVMNVIDYPPFGFVRAEAATAATRFPHVAVISGRRAIDGAAGGNLVLVASKRPLDLASVEVAIEAWGESESTVVLARRAEVDAFIGASVVLTDDFAPVDQLLGR
ncbi:MAG: fused MFS/spermidine synthase [Chloroflexota bacterium]